MGCLYTALIGYLPFFGNIPLEVFYIFIGVGLSALFVSTDRGNAKAKIRGTGIRLAPRLFLYIHHSMIISLCTIGVIVQHKVYRQESIFNPILY